MLHIYVSFPAAAAAVMFGLLWLAQTRTSHTEPAGPLTIGGPVVSMHALGNFLFHASSVVYEIPVQPAIVWQSFPAR